MSLLDEAKLPSLKDKIRAQDAEVALKAAEALKEKLEVKDEKEKVVIKKSAKKK